MTLHCVDLFCGAGGSSEGLAQACEELNRDYNLVAVNHNPIAIATHRANHPEATHFLQDIRAVRPREAVPSGRLDLLLAGAPCPHFARARGAKPMDDHERSTPREILHWPEDLDIDNILIENVGEFQTWGPLHKRGPRKGRPIKSRMGEDYDFFIDRIADMGYRIEARILNSADYGGATTRKRLFIQARKRRPITWPETTHTPETYRPAREIIDWSIPGKSIFERKKPLAKKTLARIAMGIERFCGEWAKPFLVMLYGTGSTRSIDLPCQTVTANGKGGGHIALVQFLLQQQSGGVARPVSRPAPTIAASGAQSLIEACLVPMYGERTGQAPRVHSIDRPCPTVPASGGGKFGKVDFIVKYFGTGIAHAVSEPCPTVTTKDRIGLVECDTYALDIRFRMLQPHELQAAMSFPEDYQFAGNRTERIRQIGNAWDVRLGKALVKSMLN
jgi:DNA (cytosine-5)-methyltransferase 1